jgi:hypothetical protein
MLYEKDGVSVYDKSKVSVDHTIFWTVGMKTVKLIDILGDAGHEREMGGVPGKYAYLRRSMGKIF